MSCSLCAICHYCISGVRSPETYERVVDAIFELPAPPLPFQDSTPGAALPWEVSCQPGLLYVCNCRDTCACVVAYVV